MIHQSAGPRRACGVQVRAVAHAFNGVVAIERADLRVEPGGFLAIVGDSGGGKTTLLRLIGGLLAPTSGEIHFIDGQSPGPQDAVADGVAGSSPQSRKPVAPSNEISFCFQEGRLLPWRNVLDNVALPLELGGVPRQDRRAVASEMLLKMRLMDCERKMPAQLSGGMRMRVAMARALVTRPRLLLLDEPFGALDEVTRLALDDELRQLWLQTGTTIILVTHSIQEAVSLAQEVVVLRGKPGRTLPAIAIDLPSGSSTRTSMQFVSLCQRVYQLMAPQLNATGEARP